MSLYLYFYSYLFGFFFIEECMCACCLVIHSYSWYGKFILPNCCSFSLSLFSIFLASLSIMLALLLLRLQSLLLFQLHHFLGQVCSLLFLFFLLRHLFKQFSQQKFLLQQANIQCTLIPRFASPHSASSSKLRLLKISVISKLRCFSFRLRRMF